MDSRLEDTLNWLADSIYRVLSIAIIGVLLFVWGCDRAFFYPQRMKEAAIEETTILLDQIDHAVNLVTDRLQNQRRWYLKDNKDIDGLDASLRSVKTMMHIEIENGAHWYFERAKAEADAYVSYDLSHQAQQRAQEALQITFEMNSKMVAMDVERATVRQHLIDVSQNYTATLKILSAFVVRKESELQYHLSKHKKGLDPTFNELLQKSTQAEQARLHAVELMPPNSDTRGVGNATLAQQELDHAKALIDEMNTLMQQMTAALDELEQARLHAAELTVEASTVYTNVFSYVNDVNKKTSFWLKNSYATLEQATIFRDNAKLAIVTKIEDEKVDFVLAYDSATKSIALSNKAKAQADAEVADELTTKQAIEKFASKLVEVNSFLTAAKQAKQTLASYHHASTWASVQSSIGTAEAMIGEATTYRDKAMHLIKLEVQQFANGKTEANNALTKLDNALAYTLNVIQLKDKLESFRAQWQGAESQASSTLNAEYANVQSYGGYDAGAVTAYNTAVTALRSARANASSGLYEQAVNEAHAAYNGAVGTGARALSAYNAEMQRRARATASAIAQATSDARAREAEQHAAEERARRAAESRSSSSNSSGISPSGGSNHSDSDYGRSGSDNDYGTSGLDNDY